MIVTIENIPAYRIAFIRSIGPYGSGNVQTMERLKEWARLNGLLNDESVILGIAQDNPETTKAENCRYDACLIISNDDIEDDTIKKGQIAAGNYAVFTISHTAQAVTQAWNDIFPEMFKQGYLLDMSRPILERYSTKMVSKHLCEICVPIR